jgi:hypothetical protein
MPLPGHRLGRRRAGRIAAAALLVVVAVIVVLVLRSQGSPSSTGATAATSDAGVTTVRRRDLVQTDTESGTLGYADPQTVYNRISGTITWLPKVGHVIRPGHVLYRVGDQPVLLMDGSTPAYRDLGPDDAPGPDLTELNRNLVKLGFNPDGIALDDEWQTATSAGVDVLQESLGEPETGILSLGQIVFLPGPQLVSTLDATVGGTGSGGSSAGSSGADAAVDQRRAAEFASLAVTTSTATSATATSSSSKQRSSPPTPATSSSTASTPSTTSTTSAASTSSTTSPGAPSGPAPAPTAEPTGSADTAGLHSAIDRLGSEIAQLRRELQAERSADTKSSATADKSANADPSATPILQTSATRLVVTVDLPAGSASEAVVGRHVIVQMPAGNSVKGTIAAVSRVAESSSSSSGSSAAGGGDSGSSSTVPVTIRLRGHAGAGLDQAAVSVAFVRSRARHVLSVPVTALVATSGQRYALQEAAAPHRLIAVHTGLFAAGYVQVSGAGITPGMRVSDSEG